MAPHMVLYGDYSKNYIEMVRRSERSPQWLAAVPARWLVIIAAVSLMMHACIDGKAQARLAARQQIQTIYQQAAVAVILARIS